MNKKSRQLILVLSCVTFFACIEQNSLDRTFYTINTHDELTELKTKRYNVKFLTIGSNYSDSIYDILEILDTESLTGLTLYADSVIIHQSKDFSNLEYLNFYAQYLSIDKNFFCADSIVVLTICSDSIGPMDFIFGKTIKNLTISTERKQIEEWISQAGNIENLWVDSSVYEMYEKNLPINTNLGFIK